MIVLHDLPGAAVDRLDELLTTLREQDVEFTTATPDDCTPVRAGAPPSSFGLLGVALEAR